MQMNERVTDAMVEAAAKVLANDLIEIGLTAESPVASADGKTMALWETYLNLAHTALTAALSSAEEKAVEVSIPEETVQRLCDLHGKLLRVLDEKIGLKVFMADEVASMADLMLDAAKKLDQAKRAALVDVPAVESEPVGEQWCAFEDGQQKTSWYPDGYGYRAGWAAIAKRNPEKYQVVTRPVYAHPPRSSLIQSDKGEIARKAVALSSALLTHYSTMEDGDGNEAPELAMARDILALSTRKCTAGGTSATSVSGGRNDG